MNEQEEEDGFENVRFAPAPGATYTFTVSSRSSAVLRFLKPGWGINVSFVDWDDPTFDIATGKFVEGTKSTDIELAAGFTAFLFGGVVQFTYGWNLNAEHDQSYYGLGFSFVNIVQRVGSLLQ